MERLKVHTIGFTKKSAEAFFGLLMEAGVERVIDIRLKNVSQLAGFARRDDLKFFLKTIGDIDYQHMPQLAPTEEILTAYKKGNLDWEGYRRAFIELIAGRCIEEKLSKELLHRSCLLCSEALPEQCHRRLVAEYLREKWGDVDIIHLT